LSTPKFIIEEIFNVINPKKEKFDEELKKLWLMFKLVT
jgi:hypothetical protein